MKKVRQAGIAAESFYALSPLDVGLRRTPLIPAFLSKPLRVQFFGKGSGAIHIGWGRKKSGLRAVRLARKSGSAYCLLEDGFLRSVGLGNQDPPLSIVFDSQGIYYDSLEPSALESQIMTHLEGEERARAEKLITLWRHHRVSKYNHLPEYYGELPQDYVLLADQTVGDASIRYGQATAESFAKMLQAALESNPDSVILVKIHPDVLAGRKKGHFDIAKLKENPRIRVLGEDVHPVRLIEHARAIYVVTSQLGLEGLIWGKPVLTFGMPFYAGYGLTTDAITAPDRRKPVSVEQLVFASLVRYPRYLDPETKKISTPERLIEWMGLQRHMRSRFLSPVYAPNFSRWKKPIVADFFQGSEVRFIDNVSDYPGCGTLTLWGRATQSPAPPECTVYLEDGFLRSVGLGADLVRPLSWVMDRRGIYYDSRSPSDLEHILQTASFDDELRSRAHKLRERIVRENLTKYNVGQGNWARPATSQRVILVPGQVESDASIRFGSPVLRRNMELLKAVREANPDAYVIYKPHPDVVAGLRDAGDGEQSALQWCDEVVVDLPIGELFALVDEVHVLTSLAGFEALLRGRKVVTYGQPFYSGWGLTIDHYPETRRTRALDLDELVAGVLILYPTYISRQTGQYTSPENAMEELLQWKEAGVSGMAQWRKTMRPVLGMIARLRGKR